MESYLFWSYHCLLAFYKHVYMFDDCTACSIYSMIIRYCAIIRNWISTSSNPITNALEIYKDRKGQYKLISSNNDAMVRILNLETG